MLHLEQAFPAPLTKAGAVRDYPQNIIGKTRPGQNWQRERVGSVVKV